ncbi:hypothetical protein ACI4AF_29495, partial [Klebsiella pneumoniae]|uniref:hypothetical protein n=1 Tax=Klebsiella pneumoniae TaxID=573 RepID=UPI003854A5B9
SGCCVKPKLEYKEPFSIEGVKATAIEVLPVVSIKDLLVIFLLMVCFSKITKKATNIFKGSVIKLLIK